MYAYFIRSRSTAAARHDVCLVAPPNPAEKVIGVQLGRWASAPNLFAQLNEGKDRTMAQLALKFCLSPASVSTVIPGMMNNAEVTENVKAGEMPPLSENEVATIRSIYEQNSFYDSSIKRDAVDAKP